MVYSVPQPALPHWLESDLGELILLSHLLENITIFWKLTYSLIVFITAFQQAFIETMFTSKAPVDEAFLYAKVCAFLHYGK